MKVGLGYYAQTLYLYRNQCDLGLKQTDFLVLECLEL